MQKNTAIRVIALVAIIVLLVLIGRIVIEQVYADRLVRNPEYQSYMEHYQEQVKEEVDTYSEVQHTGDFGEIGFVSEEEGTTSNFEGPQAHVQGLEFHGQIIDKNDPRMEFYDGNTINFDPDHPSYGFPNVAVRVSPVTLYEAKKDDLDKVLKIAEGDDSKPSPYRTYTKIIESTYEHLNQQQIKMQLWLTEFEVTIDVIPDRKKSSVTLTDREKKKFKYPAKWYNLPGDEIDLTRLTPEPQNNRYTDLTLVLKLIPNNAPWYFKVPGAQNVRPHMAIGAVYCEEVRIMEETDLRRVSPNTQKGSVVFLHPTYMGQSGSPPTDMTPVPEDLQEAVGQMIENSLDHSHEKIQSIWDKPYYMKIHFDNIGSWQESRWWWVEREYDDQVTYKFIMPIFVMGSWDIVPPQEIIPTWEPPEPFIKHGFHLSDLLPEWGLGKMGKYISATLFSLIFVVVLLILFPALLPLIIRVFFAFIRLVKKGITSMVKSISGLFAKKKKE